MTDARPRVDVGVLTWNTADVTPTALRRLLDSDQGVDLRLLVRDNGSSDGTPDRIGETVPEADLERGTENLGFAAGVNAIIARSKAPWFFLLNSDAWPLDGAIGRLVAAADGRPRAAAIAPRIEYPDGRLQHSTHPFPSSRVAATLAFRRDLPAGLGDELFLEGAWMHDRPRRLDWAIGAALLMRRAAIEDIGGFDESFFFYAEDLEWCWRAHRKGWEIWFEPRAVVHHIANASGEQMFGVTRNRAHMANAWRFYRREHGAIAATTWWALNVAGSSRRLAGALARRDRGGARNWAAYTRAQIAAPFIRERAPARRSRS
jgi:GT2 family glycosyltransferase